MVALGRHGEVSLQQHVVEGGWPAHPAPTPRIGDQRGQVLLVEPGIEEVWVGCGRR